MSTIFELEDALVEFVAQNTEDFRFASNETTDEMICPAVWSGFIPRDEVGSILPGDISVYPAIIICAQNGVQNARNDRCEAVSVTIVVGCFDSNLDQQGYRDCCNVVQRLRDRFREVDIIRERFPLRFPLSWSINRRSGATGQMNSFPYYFAEMQFVFDLPVMETQFDVGIWDGDTVPGRYNQLPIPTPPPLEHDKLAEPPVVDMKEHVGIPMFASPAPPTLCDPTHVFPDHDKLRRK